MDRYETVKPLSDGDSSSAIVQRKADNEQFVCKTITYASIDDANRGLQGALSLARFSSEFVTHYEDIFFHIRDDNNSAVFDLNLVTEYCSGGSLWNKLLSKRDSETAEIDLVPLVLAEKWIVELCKGLRSVHQLKVIHKDLKSENIFLNSHDDIKIGEFGLGNLKNTEKKESTSQFYLAPELIKTPEHNMKTDIWSLGCILFEISTSRLLPADKINFNELLNQGGKDTLVEHIRKYFAKDRAHLLALVEFILEPDAGKRPNIDQIMAHEFFNNYKLQSHKAKELQAHSFSKIDINFQDGIVRQLNKIDFDVTSEMMAQELYNEPRMRFLFSRDDNKRKKLSRIFLNTMLQMNAQRGNNTWGRFAPDGRLQATAVWFPPDRTLRPSVSTIAKVGFDNLGDLLKIGPKFGIRIRTLLEFIQKTIEAEFPDNCWILFFVAVSNQFQTKGIGRHLLSHILTVADYHGQDCGTLCFDGHAVEFFNKLGFQLHKMIPVPLKNMPKCPPCQIMIRKARNDIDHSLSPQSSSDNLTSSKKKRHSKNVL